MRRYLISLLVLAFIISVVADIAFCSTPSEIGDKEKTSSDKKKVELVWYKYDVGMTKAKKEKKHPLVHFYTNWCGWCKRMDKTTFSDEAVIEVLNESYVPIRVNGQSGEKVKVDGKESTERQVAGKYGVRAYPITWFLKPSGERIAPRRGYVKPEEFLYILNWVKDDLYEETSFQEFVKQEQKKQNPKKKESK
ncbi:MAG: thioredoxin fold domain-containing protein [Candidatus Zixiibacteriota bacterium]